MPDIQTPASYRRKMVQIENAYLGSVKRFMGDGRREMIDILSINGVKMSTTPLLVNVAKEISIQTTDKAAEIARMVDKTGLWYLEQQRKQLYMLGEQIPTTDELSALTALERVQIYNQTLIKEPQWISDMVKSLEINMTRLSAAGADLSAAADRLLSNTIADGRASVLRMASANAQKEISTNIWVSGLSALNLLYRATQKTTQTTYSKQAVAAIDERTTDCCLRVHGQIQPLDKPFILYGSPRFSDKVDSPPFHWYCRSAQTLYTEKLENRGPTTQEMMDAARAELEAREKAGLQPIHPAHSTSGR